MKSHITKEFKQTFEDMQSARVANGKLIQELESAQKACHIKDAVLTHVLEWCVTDSPSFEIDADAVRESIGPTYRKGWVSPEKVKALVGAGDELAAHINPAFPLTAEALRDEWDSAKKDL